MDMRVKIGDILLIAALVAVCFAVWFFPKSQGSAVVISVDGAVVRTLNLKEDQILDLPDGTRVIVEHQSVRVEYSTCPDHLCEHMGAVSKTGEVILCVPNRISVEIRGEGVDALVG